jgi:hypothetical protein
LELPVLYPKGLVSENEEAMTFDLFPLRFHFVANSPIHFPMGAGANLLRGALGKSLMRISPDAYARWFSPESLGGPSGLRDAPRPFVFRAAHLDGAAVHTGQAFDFGLNVFETCKPVIGFIAQAFEERFGKVTALEGRGVLHLPLVAAIQPADRVRVHFLTPTEIKGAERPDFGPLFARLRDRISTLRASYGGGPLEIDFKSMGERAARIAMTRCDLQHVKAERTSRATGQRHPLGGFIGVAEYEGDVAEFLPYLEIARWTGVGRQTVWGNGEIAWETF